MDVEFSGSRKENSTVSNNNRTPSKRQHNQKVRIPLRAPSVTSILGTQNYSRAQKKNENYHHKPYFKRLQKVSQNRLT